MTAMIQTLTNMPLNALLTTCAVGMAVLVLICGVLLDFWRKKDSGLEAHLLRASAAGSIPTGVVLISAGLDPSILAELSGINVYITFAGFALVYVSIKAISNIYEQKAASPMQIRRAAPRGGEPLRKG